MCGSSNAGPISNQPPGYMDVILCSVHAQELHTERRKETGHPAMTPMQEDPLRCRTIVRGPNGENERCLLTRHGGIRDHCVVVPVDVEAVRRARDAEVWDAAAGCLTDLAMRATLRGLNPHRAALESDMVLPLRTSSTSA